MKNFAIPATFSIRGQQSKSALSAHKSMFVRGAFKNVRVDSLAPVGIKKMHVVQFGFAPMAYGAALPDELPGAFVYYRSNSSTHIGFLRLPLPVVQGLLAFNEVDTN